MTREEIKAKLEQAKTNKVLPENMRALSIAKYEKMLADLPEDKADKNITTLKELEKKDPKMYEWYLDLKRDTGMIFSDFKEQYLSTKAEPKKEVKKTGHKYKLGDMYRSDFDYDGMMEYAKKANEKTPLKDLKKLSDSMEDVNYHTEAKKIFALIDKKNKASKNEPKKVEPKKAESKELDDDYCAKLIAEVKAKREKAKKSAEKSAKKPEVTKAKERIEKTYEAIENKVEKGEFTKSQLQKLIEETREYLKRLEKAIKSLGEDKFAKGGEVNDDYSKVLNHLTKINVYGKQKNQDKSISDYLSVYEQPKKVSFFGSGDGYYSCETNVLLNTNSKKELIDKSKYVGLLDDEFELDDNDDE